jgi:hypothetical protein
VPFEETPLSGAAGEGDGGSASADSVNNGYGNGSGNGSRGRPSRAPKTNGGRSSALFEIESEDEVIFREVKANSNGNGDGNGNSNSNGHDNGNGVPGSSSSSSSRNNNNSSSTNSNRLQRLGRSQQAGLEEVVRTAWRQVLVLTDQNAKDPAPSDTSSIHDGTTTAPRRTGPIRPSLRRRASIASAAEKMHLALDASFFGLGGDIIGLAQLSWLLEQRGFPVARIEDLIAHPTVRGHMGVLAAGRDDWSPFAAGVISSASGRLDEEEGAEDGGELREAAAEVVGDGSASASASGNGAGHHHKGKSGLPFTRSAVKLARRLGQKKSLGDVFGKRRGETS